MIFIRHGKKCWNNKGIPYVSGYKHDSPLDMKYKEDIIKNIPSILYYYYPTKIITSPFLRCRQTSEILANILNIPVEIDNDLREYLGHIKTDLSIENDTLNYLKNETIIETFNDFSKRIKSINCDKWTNKKYLIVSHGIVISEITKISSPRFGGYIYFTPINNDITIKFNVIKNEIL